MNHLNFLLNQEDTEIIEEIDLDELFDDKDDDDFEWKKLKVDKCPCGHKCKGIQMIKAYVPRKTYKNGQTINEEDFSFIQKNYEWVPYTGF